MDIYAKGQLSFLILNCLLDRDFYGLDIISEVKNRSNGRITLKKPSVYSNLTRMEKQGQVSSYMRASDVGPNRKYYSITEKGRITYWALKEEFDKNHFDVFRDYEDESSEPSEAENEIQEVRHVEESQNEVDEQNDFFDFSDLSSEDAVENTMTKEVEQKSEFEERQIEDSTESIMQQEENTSPENDAVLLPKQDELQDASEYNKRIYDITKDFNKYRKNRSFAEDQMAITQEDNTSFQDSEARRQEHLENFKSALLANKGKFSERMSDEEFNKFKETSPSTNEETVTKEEERIEETRDDGVFITGSSENYVFKTQKIEPPRLKINPEPAPLPAPKRDATIDPSHKEIISRLYSKSKGDIAQAEQQTPLKQEALYDYEDLFDYYSAQSISFRPYKQTKTKVKHNTNKIELIVSLLTFTLLCAVSGVLFAIFAVTGFIKDTTSFLYIVLPLLFLIDVIIKAFAMKYTSWEPKAIWPQWLVWALLVLCVGITFGVNFIFGMNANAMLESATTLILPIGLLTVLFPVRYYIKRFAYKLYWK